VIYGIVFETATDGGVGAYLPDMPGVGVVASDKGEAIGMLDQAVRWHVDGLIEDGLPLPSATQDQSFEAYIILDRTYVRRVDAGIQQFFFESDNAAPLWLAHDRYPVIRRRVEGLATPA